MEQFRQIGEVLGGMKALMVFRENIQINERQCSLLLDIFSFAFETISDEMKNSLKFEEKNMKWKVLECPLKELYRVFKEGETFIKYSLENRNWWAKAIILHQNADAVEFHINNLLCSVPIVIEAIETVAETSGGEQEEIQKKKLIYSNKYQKEWKDPQLFQWEFGKQYLMTPEFCNRIETVGKEDRWILLNKIQEKKVSKQSKRRLAELLLKNLDYKSGSLTGKLLPSSILLGTKDYLVRRRLGNGNRCKEIIWFGESFALRTFIGDIDELNRELTLLLSLTHPNIMYYLCGFMDEEKKECYLVMELMNKKLSGYINEICGPKKKGTIPLTVVVDLMLQIARGMEYLHSKKMYHGDLNPSNILVKSRGGATDGYLHAKVSGFGLAGAKTINPKNAANQDEAPSFIWYAPEVLEEQEHVANIDKSKYTEKGDVYSFGMICFQLLTGKVPFEDSNLQGDKMSRNIRAGERPLFPSHTPNYLTTLTRKCWHNDPNQRPRFSSIGRILRSIKKFMAMNPDYANSGQDTNVLVPDYCDIELRLLQKFPSWESNVDFSPILQIPFQMFVYRVIEREKTNTAMRDVFESGSDKASISGDENLTATDELLSPSSERRLSATNGGLNKRPLLVKKLSDTKTSKQPGTPKGRLSRPPQVSPCRTSRVKSENQLISPRMKRSLSGHASDSDVP